MDKDLTEIVYILDRSGSMSGLEADTIGAFLDRGEWGKVIKRDFEKRAKKRILSPYICVIMADE